VIKYNRNYSLSRVKLEKRKKFDLFKTKAKLIFGFHAALSLLAKVRLRFRSNNNIIKETYTKEKNIIKNIILVWFFKML